MELGLSIDIKIGKREKKLTLLIYNQRCQNCSIDAWILDIYSERIARESKIYSYRRSFNGFAARLLPHEATYLSSMPNNKKMYIFPIIICSAVCYMHSDAFR